jgi:hypothetical protein
MTPLMTTIMKKCKGYCNEETGVKMRMGAIMDDLLVVSGNIKDIKKTV